MMERDVFVSAAGRERRLLNGCAVSKGRGGVIFAAHRKRVLLEENLAALLKVEPR